MNDIEKARAYDEAMKRAKAAIDIAADKDLVGGVVRTVFPELAESEDERIRQEIRDFILYNAGKDITEETEHRWVTWLEKQKEQKPADYDHEMWKNCEVNFEGDKKEVIEHPEKYGLQKSAEWSKEETKDLVHILKVLDDCYAYGKHDLSKNDHNNLTNRIKFLRPSWKPSEEQMTNLLRAEGRLRIEGENVLASKLAELYEQLKKL